MNHDDPDHHIQNNLESIDSCFSPRSPAARTRRRPQNWGENRQTGGEYAIAAGAVGTVIPVLAETGIPEGVAAGGGAAWLIGKGAKALGGLF